MEGPPVASVTREFTDGPQVLQHRYRTHWAWQG